MPTVASTDAPTSALAVVYTAEGAFEEYRFFPRNPDLVLVDTQVVANAPAALLAAGVGDALATWLEARATAASGSTTMAGGAPTLAGTALARLSWDVLWDNALPALDAVRDHLVTPAVEKVVEANTLLSGLGFESGGLAAAHAVHNGLTAAPQAHGLAHGQKVNLGSVTQLVLEGAPTSEIRDFVEFTTRVGLPNTLTEVGLGVDDVDVLRAVAQAATVPGETIHSMPFPVRADDVVAALRSSSASPPGCAPRPGCPPPSATSRTTDRGRAALRRPVPAGGAAGDRRGVARVAGRARAPRAAVGGRGRRRPRVLRVRRDAAAGRVLRPDPGRLRRGVRRRLPGLGRRRRRVPPGPLGRRGGARVPRRGRDDHVRPRSGA